MQRLRDLQLSRLDDQPVGKYGRSSKSVGLSVFESADTDVSSMSASAVINTDVVDYQGEVILASGVDVQNYKGNPTVLYEHGKCSAVHLPIGKSVDPSGKLLIDRTEYEIEGTTYFSQAYPEAVQIFGLIDEGVIRATSIQVMPVHKSAFSDEKGNRYEVTDQSHLIEYSWCRLGVNPEAVKKSLGIIPDAVSRAVELQRDHAARILDRGTVGNERLISPIRKSLEEMLPQARASSPGFDFTESQMLKHLTDLEIERMSKPELARAVSNLGEYEESIRPQLKSLYEKMIGNNDQDEASEGNDDDQHGDDRDVKSKGSVPLGADITGKFHGGLGEMADYFEDLAGPLEKEEVKVMVTEAIGSLRSIQAAMGSMHSELYPDLPAPGEKKKETADEQAGEKRYSDTMKSWIGESQMARHQVLGMAGQIKSVGEMDGMPKKAIEVLSCISQSLQSIESQSKAFAAKPSLVPQEEFDALKKESEAWRSRCEKAVKKLAAERLPAGSFEL